MLTSGTLGTEKLGTPPAGLPKPASDPHIASEQSSSSAMICFALLSSLAALDDENRSAKMFMVVGVRLEWTVASRVSAKDASISPYGIRDWNEAYAIVRNKGKRELAERSVAAIVLTVTLTGGAVAYNPLHVISFLPFIVAVA
jgi:hypothetical protein